MNDSVEIQISSTDTESIVDEFSIFFEPLARPVICREEERAIKSWDAAIGIVINIVGSWAAKRYILDSLANRTDQWLKGVTWSWQKSRQKRPIRITIRFEDESDGFDIDVSGTTDQEVLKGVWSDIQKAVEVRNTVKERGTVLDKIRIIPDGSHRILVIGYEGSRPHYTINLGSGTLHAIPLAHSVDEEPSFHLFAMTSNVQALEYRRMLVDKGHTVSEDQIAGLVRSIDEEKSKLLPP
jgi:hypothetical protein